MANYRFVAAGLAASLMLSTGYPALAQTSMMQSKMAKHSAVDAKFMVQAGQSDQTEIKTSQLALDRTSNPEVRKYAQQMIDEHTKSSSELKPLAEQEGVTLSTNLAPKQQALYDKLSKLNGEQFDQAYMVGQTQAHVATAAIYRKEIRSGKDTQVKQFARQVLPTVEGHLKEARAMSSNMASSMTKGSMSGGNMSKDNMSGGSMSGGSMSKDNMSKDNMGTDSNRPPANTKDNPDKQMNDNINATPSTTNPPR